MIDGDEMEDDWPERGVFSGHWMMQALAFTIAPDALRNGVRAAIDEVGRREEGTYEPEDVFDMIFQFGLAGSYHPADCDCGAGAYPDEPAGPELPSELSIPQDEIDAFLEALGIAPTIEDKDRNTRREDDK